jgi:tetratricopeptide (TPR) repeat protein
MRSASVLLRSSVLCAAALAVVCPARPASAQAGPATPAEAPSDAERVRQIETLAADAQARYAEGRYPEAIKLYLQAYQLAPEAALLFNVAVIYDQQVRDPDIAIEYYRKYVTSPGADPDAVVQATERIEALKASRERTAATPAATPAPAPTAPGVAPAPERETPLRTIVGWSLVGLGGALAVGGTVVGVMAQSDEEAFRQSSDVVSKRDLRDRGETRALAADVMFATAGAAVIGGAVLLLFGGDDAPGTPGAAIVPVAGGGVGLVRF